MSGLNWHGKPLHELDYEETVEFEKEVMKRMLGADRAGMSDGIIQQLQSYLTAVKEHKAEQLELFHMGLDGSEEKKEESSSMIIGEPIPEPDDEDK